MSLKVCSDCGAAYAPADQCPQCGGGVFRFSWEEEEMAKATVGGGGSNFAEGVPAPLSEDAAMAAAAVATARSAKADLVAVAIAKGVDPDKAQAMTRLQLISELRY